MNTELFPYQLEAMRKMHNGCILGGSVGAGKSRTALAYVYIRELGGSLRINNVGVYSKPKTPKDIYIITTAKKRDGFEWEEEVAYFCLPDEIKVTVDSWNNIKKYTKINSAMFIFDEQRVVGKGVWVKSFLKIARRNHWILLSATPGDAYDQLIPILIANGFYQNRSQFEAEHCVFKPFLKYKDIDHYINTKRLDYYISQILVPMNYEHEIVKHKIDILCEYDREKYKRVLKDRWNIYDNCPIEEPGKLCYLLRRVSNSDDSREDAFADVLKEHSKLIAFYNFDYELDILKAICETLGVLYREWNGHTHQPIPEGDSSWVYLCQYAACSEGWNCITTNTIVFFSQNYSYKVLTQAEGRIDRLNTPFKELYYYYFKCKSPIDLAITRSLKLKKNFNEKIFMKGVRFEDNVSSNK